MASQQQNDDALLASFMQGVGGTSKQQQQDDVLLAGAMQNHIPANLTRQDTRDQDDVVLADIMNSPRSDRSRREIAPASLLQQASAADQQKRRDDDALAGVLQHPVLDQSKRDDAVLSVLQQALVPGKQQSRDDAALASVLGKGEATMLPGHKLTGEQSKREDDAALAGVLGKSQSRSKQKHKDDDTLADILSTAAKATGTELIPHLKSTWVPLLFPQSLNHYVLGLPRGQVMAENVAGGNGKGKQLNQLFRPLGIVVDASQSITIADNGNRRVVRWARGASQGEILAGGQTDYCFDPKGVVLAASGSFLVTVSGGVELWADGAPRGQIVATGKCPIGIAMDFTGDALLFVDMLDHCVIRWPSQSRQGIVAAGGRGPGSHLFQLHRPFGIALDSASGAIFVVDSANHRVLRWTAGAQHGDIIAGGKGAGGRLDQLNYPRGVAIEHSGDVLIADTLNHRVVRWRRGAMRGEVVAGGEGPGYRIDQLNSPNSIAIDSVGGLLIADTGNHRVVRWAIYG